AEDGIRDFHVTGVQTCALPISGAYGAAEHAGPALALGGARECPGRVPAGHPDAGDPRRAAAAERAWRADRGCIGGGPADRSARRSEERRVGREGGTRTLALLDA